jgi:hypothetical protein
VTPPRPRERELLATAARWFEGLGYRCYPDPDGTDYFDLAVRRASEVGLIEGKVGRPAVVLGQALRRRAWGDWVAVAVDSPRGAERLARTTTGRRAESVGVYAVAGDRLTEVRRPRPAAPDDPFSPCRERFRRLLDDLDAGVRPPGVRWSDVLAEVRRASGGRRFAEWRLDEPFRPGP